MYVQENPFMHEVFNLEPQVFRQRLSSQEKRLYRSPASAASKARTQQRNFDRAAATAYKLGMNTPE